MRTASVFAASLAVPALFAFSSVKADTITFGPSAGTTVTKTFTTSTVMDLDEMTVLMNGNPAPIPEMEMSTEMVQTVTVTDEYGDTKDGQPSKVTRTFDAIGSEMTMDMDMGMGGAQNPSGSGSSELEGSTVVFAWDGETGDYAVDFAEGEEGEAELLEGLTENMDVRGLLPEGELAEGESYDIDPASLVQVLAAGGDLKLDMEMEGGGGGMMGPDPATMTDFRQFFEDLLEGEATGKYVGSREVDGVKVAVIELDIEVNGAADMADMAEDMMGGEEMPEGLEMSIDRMDVAMTYEGGGELHWNMGKGIVHALAIKADLGIDMEMEMAMDMGGQAMDMSMEMAMSGEVETKIATE